jgi:hypothetical protein
MVATQSRRTDRVTIQPWDGKITRLTTVTKDERKRFHGILVARQAELENAIRNREALAVDTSSDQLDRVQRATEREMAIDNLERQSDRNPRLPVNLDEYVCTL